MNKQNRFIVITPCYNVEPYVQQNVCMNKFQTYKNVLYVYIDDNSKDTTYSTLKNLTEGDSRFLILQNTKGGSQAKTYMFGVEYLEENDLIEEDDVIVEVDGDDWLSSVFAFEYLNAIYQKESVWMTYGQYQKYPTGEVGGHYHQEINQAIDNANLHRIYAFPYSHLKTYKYWLFNKIDRKDLIDPQTGEYYSAAWDHVLCFPMVEMAGKEHTFMSEDILYILNRSEDLNNESKTRLDYQKSVEAAVRNLSPYSKLK